MAIITPFTERALEPDVAKALKDVSNAFETLRNFYEHFAAATNDRKRKQKASEKAYTASKNLHNLRAIVTYAPDIFDIVVVTKTESLDDGEGLDRNQEIKRIATNNQKTLIRMGLFQQEAERLADTGKLPEHLDMKFCMFIPRGHTPPENTLSCGFLPYHASQLGAQLKDIQGSFNQAKFTDLDPPKKLCLIPHFEVPEIQHGFRQREEAQGKGGAQRQQRSYFPVHLLKQAL